MKAGKQKEQKRKKKEKNQILHLQVIHQTLILKMKKIIKTKKIL